mmetsp:Transcript_20446/g.48088  ORF Transcript_20446/g.48088 Transcript_20446/m.48088 type:complete len:566 (-) Transcript_20446:233-1930(-)
MGRTGDHPRKRRALPERAPQRRRDRVHRAERRGGDDPGRGLLRLRHRPYDRRSVEGRRTVPRGSHGRLQHRMAVHEADPDPRLVVPPPDEGERRDPRKMADLAGQAREVVDDRHLRYRGVRRGLPGDRIEPRRRRLPPPRSLRDRARDRPRLGVVREHDGSARLAGQLALRHDVPPPGRRLRDDRRRRGPTEEPEDREREYDEHEQQLRRGGICGRGRRRRERERTRRRGEPPESRLFAASRRRRPPTRRQALGRSRPPRRDRRRRGFGRRRVLPPVLFRRDPRPPRGGRRARHRRHRRRGRHAPQRLVDLGDALRRGSVFRPRRELRRHRLPHRPVLPDDTRRSDRPGRGVGLPVVRPPRAGETARPVDRQRDPTSLAVRRGVPHRALRSELATRARLAVHVQRVLRIAGRVLRSDGFLRHPRRGRRPVLQRAGLDRSWPDRPAGGRRPAGPRQLDGHPRRRAVPRRGSSGRQRKPDERFLRIPRRGRIDDCDDDDGDGKSDPALPVPLHRRVPVASRAGRRKRTRERFRVDASLFRRSLPNERTNGRRLERFRDRSGDERGMG